MFCILKVFPNLTHSFTSRHSHVKTYFRFEPEIEILLFKIFIKIGGTKQDEKSWLEIPTYCFWKKSYVSCSFKYTSVKDSHIQDYYILRKNVYLKSLRQPNISLMLCAVPRIIISHLWARDRQSDATHIYSRHWVQLL